MRNYVNAHKIKHGHITIASSIVQLSWLVDLFLDDIAGNSVKEWIRKEKLWNYIIENQSN